MIVVYERDPGEEIYRAVATWDDGEWTTIPWELDGERMERDMSHLPDEYDTEHVLDHFSGGGTRTAVEFEDGDYPLRITPDEDTVATVGFEDDTNWMAHDEE